MKVPSWLLSGALALGRMRIKLLGVGFFSLFLEGEGFPRFFFFCCVCFFCGWLAGDKGGAVGDSGGAGGGAS